MVSTQHFTYINPHLPEDRGIGVQPYWEQISLTASGFAKFLDTDKSTVKILQ
jgi:hypothetical protein